jgi:hypothetical protein
VFVTTTSTARIDRAHWAALRRYADEGGTSFAGVSHFDSIKLFSS